MKNSKLICSIIVIALAITTCVCVFAYDSRLTPAKEVNLRALIKQNSIKNITHRKYISQAKASGIEEVAYDEYKLIWQKNRSDFYANLRFGMAAKNYYMKIAYPNLLSVTQKNKKALEVLKYATDCLTNAVQINSKSSEANSELGNHLFFPVGRQQEGFKYLEKAVKLNPNNPEANAILGDRIGYPGNNPEGLQRAIQVKKKAIELDSSYAFPHLSLSRQYLFMKRYDDTEVELHKYLELAPPNARNKYWVDIIQNSLAKNKKT